MVPEKIHKRIRRITWAACIVLNLAVAWFMGIFEIAGKDIWRFALYLVLIAFVVLVGVLVLSSVIENEIAESIQRRERAEERRRQEQVEMFRQDMLAARRSTNAYFEQRFGMSYQEYLEYRRRNSPNRRLEDIPVSNREYVLDDAGNATIIDGRTT